MAPPQASTTGVRFCPFCGESFEDEARCPEHDIPLVGFDELQRMRGDGTPDDHQALATHDPRFGRGWLVLSALVALVGFFLPFVEVAYPEGSARATGLATASTVALNLWLVPAVALALFGIVFRRRTPSSMRSARLAVAGLCILGGASLAFTLHRVRTGVAHVERAYGRDVEVVLLAGFWICAVALAVGLVGAVRFGRVPAERPRYRVE
ncbi:MAG: hypothetical protein MUE69_15570 [Myxococcota bacterium]|jgi:hypothetical protein|nr:hypothetical protein [Myxococcota bacterium]